MLDGEAISVVILEDHTLLRQSLVRLLSAEPDIVVVADTGDGRQAADVIVTALPDIAILDVEVPRRGGLDVAAEVRRRAPEVRVVFLTMHEDDTTLREAIRLEADGYLPKSASFDEVVDALRAVAGGASYLSPTIARRVLSLARGPAGARPDLTDRELEVLQLLAAGRRTNDIAAELTLSVKTVKNHLTSIYGKLGVQTAAQAVSEAYRRDIVGRHLT